MDCSTYASWAEDSTASDSSPWGVGVCHRYLPKHKVHQTIGRVRRNGGLSLTMRERAGLMPSYLRELLAVTSSRLSLPATDLLPDQHGCKVGVRA